MGSAASRLAPSVAGFARAAGIAAAALVVAAALSRPAAAGPAPADTVRAATADSTRAAPPDTTAHAAPADTTAPADTLRAAPAPLDRARALRRPVEWDTVAAGLPEEAQFYPVINFRYNRVDGPAATLGIGIERGSDPRPLLLAAYTHAFSRKRGLYEVAMHDRVGAGWPRVQLGGRLYRRTASRIDWAVGGTENTLFALFARTDYRDYYEAEGGSAYLEVDPGRDAGFRLDARAEEHRPLRTRTRFSIFGKDDRFQPNPAFPRGNDRAWTLSVRVGPEELPPRGGVRGEVSWERSGKPLTSDFDYGRVLATVHTVQRLGPRLDFRARGLLGSTREGALPPQKLWLLGGIGTLRGHEFQRFSGDQFFLVNAEQYCRLRKRSVYGFAFLDYGAAWFGTGNWGRQRPALDGGLGLRLGEGPLAFHVAKNLRESSSPVLFGVRMGGTF